MQRSLFQLKVLLQVLNAQLLVAIVQLMRALLLLLLLHQYVIVRQQLTRVARAPRVQSIPVRLS